MRIPLWHKIVLLAVFFAASGGVSAAEDAAALKPADTMVTRLARLTWAAFECAVLANEAELNADERRRLFQLGYDTGTRFVAGLKDGTLVPSEEDNVPLYFRLSLSGPTTDFALGRVYEVVADYVYKERIDTASTIPWGIQAKDKYESQNCRFLRPE